MGGQEEEETYWFARGSPTQDKKTGVWRFPDCQDRDFAPNLSPEQVLRLGSFGGTYFRPIYSSVTKTQYKDEAWKELPAEWLKGLKIKTQVASPTYRESVNKYGVKCGGSLEMWESSGWITQDAPYGWFQWYCRYFCGRRGPDDLRQISRWKKCTGKTGRWRNNLIGKIYHSGKDEDGLEDASISPVVRQTLQHWGYRVTLEDYRARRKLLQRGVGTPYYKGHGKTKERRDEEEAENALEKKKRALENKQSRAARAAKRIRVKEETHTENTATLEGTKPTVSSESTTTTTKSTTKIKKEKK